MTTKKKRAIKRPRGPVVAVSITKEVIEESKNRDSSHCMIAEAVREAFPTAKMISVDLQTIRFSDPTKGLRYTYLTPRVRQVRLVQFDQGQAVDPFSFKLRGAHVTAMHRNRPEKDLLQKQGLRNTSSASPQAVPERVGGQTAPVMRDKNSIPMSRRREFGLRAFEP